MMRAERRNRICAMMRCSQGFLAVVMRPMHSLGALRRPADTPYCEKQGNLNERPCGTSINFKMSAWQGLGDSNPRPSVLETDALPTELNPFRRGCL
jgi:hypothetical protein